MRIRVLSPGMAGCRWYSNYVRDCLGVTTIIEAVRCIVDIYFYYHPH